MEEIDSTETISAQERRLSLSTGNRIDELGVAIADFTGTAKKELTFQKDDKIIILKKDQSGWGMGKLLKDSDSQDVQLGWFPLTYVKMMSVSSDGTLTASTRGGWKTGRVSPRKDSVLESEASGRRKSIGAKSLPMYLELDSNETQSASQIQRSGSESSTGDPKSRSGSQGDDKKPHKTKEIKLEKPMLCDICSAMIWGQGKQGVLCTDCKMYMHVKCANELQECTKVSNDARSTRMIHSSSLKQFRTLQEPSKTIRNFGSSRASTTIDGTIFSIGNEDREFLSKIDLLIDNPKFHESQDEELIHFKYKYFTSVQIYQSNNKQVPIDIRYSSIIDYDITNLNTSLPAEFPIKFHFQAGFSKSLRCDGSKTVYETVSQLFKTIKNPSFPKDALPENYLVKICGFSEYLIHDVQLDKFVYIRDCLRKNYNISLTILPKTDEIYDRLQLSDERIRETKQDLFEVANMDKTTKLDKSGGSNGVISHLSVSDNFEIKILYIQNIPIINLTNESNPLLFIEAGLYFGGELLVPLSKSSTFNVSNTNGIAHVSVDTDISLTFPIEIWQIPRGARLCFTLYLAKNKPRGTFRGKGVDDLGIPLGWVNVNLVNFKGHFMNGRIYKRLWPSEKANPIGTCVENIKQPLPIIVTIEFSSFSKHFPTPVIFTPLTGLPNGEEGILNKYSFPDPPGRDDLLKLNKLVSKDPLCKLTDDDKRLLWDNRFFVANKPTALAKVLRSVDWTDPKLVAEAIKTTAFWQKPTPADALELLDARFACPEIREYAVRCLKAISDNDLKNYLLQLVQALKYEPYHDNPLSRFLISRSLLSRHTLGHFLFWHLKAEMHVAEISERYALVLETYLRGCGMDQIDEFLKQQEAVTSFYQIARDIATNSGSSLIKRKELLRKNLSSLDLPPFQVPLNPSIVVKGVIIEECRVMDSAKMPLWLVFDNVDELGKPVKIMFKSGDDLRQDMLTLQMFRIMDRLWKRAGLDFGMHIYGVLATGDNQGMLEIVSNSKTIAAIQKDLGVNGVFKESALANWLLKGIWSNQGNNNNQSNQGNQLSQVATSSSKEFLALGTVDKEQIVENSVLSIAAYCVATYVLGIGDRHNDNIMITTSGHVFHIDFGHFLGNIKKWAGISRERAPFILTPEFAYVMGGRDSDGFKKFVELSCRGFNIIRRNASTFMNLFAMMLSTGIPELKSFDDILYLQRVFNLDLSDDQSSDLFKKLIYESLNTKATQINFWFHNLAH